MFSSADRLYETLCSFGDDTTAFTSYVIEDLQAIESILELKAATWNGEKKLPDDDMKNLAKTVSAFANTEGGVLVWGITDKPRRPCPIANVRDFTQRLLDVVAFTTTPAAPGVVGHCISDDNGHGFAVLLVPESPLPPHRVACKIEKIQHHYFFRSGATCDILGHSMLADKFGRPPRPRLELTYDLIPSGISSGRFYSTSVYVLLKLKNTGRGLAKFPYLHVRVGEPYGIPEPSRHWSGKIDLTPLKYGENRSVSDRVLGVYAAASFSGRGDVVIHSGAIVDAMVIEAYFEFSLDATLTPRITYPPLTFEFDMAAEGLQLESGSESIPVDTLLEMAIDKAKRFRENELP